MLAETPLVYGYGYSKYTKQDLALIKNDPFIWHVCRNVILQLR